jgi:hypothetical protein
MAFITGYSVAFLAAEVSPMAMSALVYSPDNRGQPMKIFF